MEAREATPGLFRAAGGDRPAPHVKVSFTVVGPAEGEVYLDDMTVLKELIDSVDNFATVLVARISTETPDPVVELLTDAGINVIGPVDRAAVALSLAAQMPVDFAVVGAELAGRRSGAELADCLRETWGVPSVVLKAPSA